MWTLKAGGGGRCTVYGTAQHVELMARLALIIVHSFNPFASHLSPKPL